MKNKKELNSKTPIWFKEWHSAFFRPVNSRSSRNEKLIYVLLAAVLGLNTVGNHYHIQIWEFIIRLFGG